MLHSVVPPELIFPCDAPLPQLICVREGIVECRADAEGRLAVGRLISTDPAAYLNPRYMPGARLGERR